MSTELVPKEQVRLPKGLRCPSCGVYGTNHFEAVTGVEAHPLLGRIVIVRCIECEQRGIVEA